MTLAGILLPPSVEAVLDDYLAPGEVVVLQDKPAFGEFVLLGLGDFIKVGLLAGASLVLLLMHRRALGLLAFIAADVLVIQLVCRRIRDYYTRYIITDLRIMRISGVFSRVGYSIPLGKITDIAYTQRWWERSFGYATIEIDSASEKSGLDKLRGLNRPARFNKVLLAMVADKQGFVVPGTAALNKRRAREDQLKLNIRFDRPLSELFPEADDDELAFARAGVDRDLNERDERGYRLRVMKNMADHIGGVEPPILPDDEDLGDDPAPNEDDGGD